MWRYPATLMVAGVTVNAHHSLAITSNTCAIKGTTYWNILAHPFRSVTSANAVLASPFGHMVQEWSILNSTFGTIPLNRITSLISARPFSRAY